MAPKNSGVSASTQDPMALLRMAYTFHSENDPPPTSVQAATLVVLPRTTASFLPAAPRSGLLLNETSDCEVLRGFDAINGTKQIHRRSTSIRIRARVAAVELVLEGVTKPTLIQIASRIGRSERTLVEKFRIRDALFAFPPPEIAPNFVDCWLRGQRSGNYEIELATLLTELDANPIATRLLRGLALIHHKNGQLQMTDGFFSHALRTELLRRECSEVMLDWTGYIADALRNALLDWAGGSETLLVDVVPRLVCTLRLIDRNL